MHTIICVLDIPQDVQISQEAQEIVLQMLIKAADLTHTTAACDSHVFWVSCLEEEMFRQVQLTLRPEESCFSFGQVCLAGAWSIACYSAGFDALDCLDAQVFAQHFLTRPWMQLTHACLVRSQLRGVII